MSEEELTTWWKAKRRPKKVRAWLRGQPFLFVQLVCIKLFEQNWPELKFPAWSATSVVLLATPAQIIRAIHAAQNQGEHEA